MILLPDFDFGMLRYRHQKYNPLSSIEYEDIKQAFLDKCNELENSITYHQHLQEVHWVQSYCISAEINESVYPKKIVDDRPDVFIVPVEAIRINSKYQKVQNHIYKWVGDKEVWLAIVYKYGHFEMGYFSSESKASKYLDNL